MKVICALTPITKKLNKHVMAIRILPDILLSWFNLVCFTPPPVLNIQIYRQLVSNTISLKSPLNYSLFDKDIVYLDK